MDYTPGKSSGGSDPYERMVEFTKVAQLCAAFMAERWANMSQNILAVDAGKDRQMRVAVLIIRVIGRQLSGQVDFLHELGGKLSTEEYGFLFDTILQTFEANNRDHYQLVAAVIAPCVADDFFGKFVSDELSLLVGGIGGAAIPLAWDRMASVVPEYDGKLLPPELRDDPNFVVLIHMDPVANVSFYFDTLQAAHMHDKAVLKGGGMEFEEMRLVNKKPGSRYTYTKMSEFVTHVVPDLLQAFNSAKGMITREGVVVNFAIQGQTFGNTKVEMSGGIFYGHYFVTLHCYPDS
ncbi:MAG: hypothetical protein V4505_15335 [Pseudomonadota bacterium]